MTRYELRERKWNDEIDNYEDEWRPVTKEEIVKTYGEQGANDYIWTEMFWGNLREVK